MIDPTDAPAGCIAVAEEDNVDICLGCCFEDQDIDLDCTGRNCGSTDRKDHTDVIFKEKE